MQYTLRDIPKSIDKALRAKARTERKSLNKVAVDALAAGLGLTGEPIKRRDLTGIAGTWVEDPETEAILREQDRIDPEMWK